VNQALAAAARGPLEASEFAMTQRDFKDIAAMLYADAGIYIPETKTTLVYSRLVKRLRALNLENFRDYCDLVGSQDGAGERLEMLSALTTNVTRFFRDAKAFEVMAQKVVPELVRTQPPGRPIRIWVAGCSTGQEAYSIAMLFLEAIEATQRNIKLQVFASDIDEDAVTFAREGLYPASIEADVPAASLRRFFTKESQSYRVSRDLRESSSPFTI